MCPHGEGEVQVERSISMARLHTLLCFDLPPIYVVVSDGPSGNTYLERGFPLRCFQWLSCPNVATRQCIWRYNRHTRGSSTPVLSY